MKEDGKCYKCNAPATSREHVPPLCLFPEKKDIGEDIFRKNLITVPSCNLHNTKKSSDDEFLMACITSIVGNNGIGYIHTHTKVKRALARKSENFIHSLMKNPEKFVATVYGKKIPVWVGSPNFKRLHKCFEHIAYGLYYAEYNTTFRGEVGIFPGFLTYHDENTEKMKQFCMRRFEVDDTKLDIKGANPKIFTYQFLAPDQSGLIALKITFYGGTDVLVSFIPENTKLPYLLGFELIKAGVRTVVTLGEHERFEFNFNI